MKSYSTLERNGFVFVWYHAEGVDPAWEPPQLDQVAGGQWKYCGRSEHHINAHIEVGLYTWGEVTSQNLWPRYDRHFVGITWHNVTV